MEYTGKEYQYYINKYSNVFDKKLIYRVWFYCNGSKSDITAIMNGLKRNNIYTFEDLREQYRRTYSFDGWNMRNLGARRRQIILEVYYGGCSHIRGDANKFKDLYLVHFYPVKPHSRMTVYQLGDLGLIPEDEDYYGGIEDLRNVFRYYRNAIVTRRPIIKPTGHGTIMFYNNSSMCLLKAKNAFDAIDKFHELLKES